MLAWLHRLEEGLLAVLAVFLILLAGTQVGMRLLLEQGIVGAEAMMRALLLWLTLLGAMLAARTDRHIAIDALAHLLPETGQRLVACFTRLLAAAVCALLAVHAGSLLALEGEGGLGSALLHFGLLPVAFAVMALRYAAHGVAALAGKTPA